jgi:hypothetical protein
MVNRIRTTVRIVLSILTFAVIAAAAQAGLRWNV